jgi:hypothetical protein
MFIDEEAGSSGQASAGRNARSGCKIWRSQKDRQHGK